MIVHVRTSNAFFCLNLFSLLRSISILKKVIQSIGDIKKIFFIFRLCENHLSDDCSCTNVWLTCASVNFWKPTPGVLVCRGVPASVWLRRILLPLLLGFLRRPFLIHSLTPSLTYSVTHSPPPRPSLTHSPCHALCKYLTHSVNHSITHSSSLILFTHWLTHKNLPGGAAARMGRGWLSCRRRTTESFLAVVRIAGALHKPSHNGAVSWLPFASQVQYTK